MARSKAASEYVCQSCAATVPRWEGQCRTCGAWNSLVETLVSPRTHKRGLASVAVQPDEMPRSLAELQDGRVARRAVGMPEVDRLLGGGLVPGSSLLLGGEPGIGKSTLVAQIAGSVAAQPSGPDVLYATAEESAGQLQLRAERLGLVQGDVSHSLKIMAATNVESIIAAARQTGPGLLIVDSISTVHLDGLDGPPGSVGQVRESALRLGAYARDHEVPVLLVGHVTKDGTLAGPRSLEHLVDAVLMLEGDRYGSLRLLRSLKNRHGSTEEIGVFEMTGSGLSEVVDPGSAFLGEGRRDAPGVAVVAVLEGTRPLLVEVQALVAGGAAGSPRRTVSGVDGNRLALLIAVLARRGRIDVSDRDVYATLGGGMSVSEPALDLALALAIASSRQDLSLPPDMLVLGEISLLGEVRSVSGLERRLREAARLGFRRALVPARAGVADDGISTRVAPSLEITEVRTLTEALGHAFEGAIGTSG